MQNLLNWSGIALIRRSCLYGLGAVLAALVGFGCGGGGSESGKDDPDVVAAYKGGVVRRAEFDGFVRPDLKEDPQVAEVSDQDWREVNIREIVLRKMLEPEVADDDPAVQYAVRNARGSIMVALMTDELGWNRIPISKEEAQEQYDTHPHQYKEPEKCRIQFIYLRAEAGVTSEDERAKVREKLEGIREEILSGAEFGEMAKRHSQSETARMGGFFTLKADADAFPEFKRVVWSLERNEISEVFDTPTGFQLVTLVERSEAFDRPYDEVKEFVIRRARLNKLKRLQAQFVSEAGPGYGMEKHYERLEDPQTSESTPLISMSDMVYTFSDLTGELPDNLVEQLYAGHYPAVHDFLDNVAVNKLLVLEAERLKLHERDEIAELMTNTVREAKYASAMSRRLKKKAESIDDATLQEYFEQNEQRYHTLRTRHLDVIFLKPAEDELLWQTLKRGEDLVERIRAGEDFAELARAHSSHYSAPNGGRMEYITDFGFRLWIQPRMLDQVKALNEGEVADARIAECYDATRLQYIQTGVVIVRLVENFPPVQHTFENLKDKVRTNYLRRNYQQFEDEETEKLLRQADIKIYHDRLPPI